MTSPLDLDRLEKLLIKLPFPTDSVPSPVMELVDAAPELIVAARKSKERQEMLSRIHGQLGVRGDEFVDECAYRLHVEHAQATQERDQLRELLRKFYASCARCPMCDAVRDNDWNIDCGKDCALAEVLK